MSWGDELLGMKGVEHILFSPFAAGDTQKSADMADNPVFLEMGPMQRSLPTLWRWRLIRLAISACNRMRLVMESKETMDAKTAEQTETEIKLAFPEASQASPSDPFQWLTDVERLHQWIAPLMPKFTHKFSRTPAGKVRLEMESLESVEKGVFYQVLSEVFARINHPPSLPLGSFEETQDPGLLNRFPWLARPQNANEFASQEDYVNEALGWPVDNQVVRSTNSATISPGDEAIQSGIIDQFSQERIASVLGEAYPPPSDSHGQFDTPPITMSTNTCIGEATDVIGSGFCDQEQYETSEYSDSPRKSMENDPRWKDIQSDVTKRISGIFDEINQASDRTKLQSTQGDARDCSSRLQNWLHDFQIELTRMVEEITITLGRVSKNVHPHLEQQLKRAISRIKLFNDKKQLFHEGNLITKKLDKIVYDLGKRNLSTLKMFQNCSMSVAQLVESVLAMTASFISVGDFNLYSYELYKLPNFRHLSSGNNFFWVNETDKA